MSAENPKKSAVTDAVVGSGTSLEHAASNTTPFPKGAVAVTPVAVPRDNELTVNPDAAGLLEPGKSTSALNAGYIESFKLAEAGDPVRFELTECLHRDG